MEKIRTLIVDDEPLAREGVRVLLEQDPDVEVVGECANGREAVLALEDLEPDLLFLDVQMPEMDGFEVLTRVDAACLPVVIFATAYDEHAVRSFEVHALDYLLKPFKDDRFRTALKRAKTQIQQQKVSEVSQRLVALLEHATGDAPSPARSPAPSSYLTRLVIKAGGRVFFINVEEIDWIEAADYYVRLHVGGKSHLMRETMTNLERQLDPRRFQRIHRSTIVQLDSIATLEPYYHGDYVVLLRDGTQLKMSRRYRQKVEAALGQSL
jgi:two-component system LytT family response regulator